MLSIIRVAAFEVPFLNPPSSLEVTLSASLNFHIVVFIKPSFRLKLKQRENLYRVDCRAPPKNASFKFSNVM